MTVLWEYGYCGTDRLALIFAIYMILYPVDVIEMLCPFIRSNANL